MGPAHGPGTRDRPPGATRRKTGQQIGRNTADTPAADRPYGPPHLRQTRARPAKRRNETIGKRRKSPGTDTTPKRKTVTVSFRQQIRRATATRQTNPDASMIPTPRCGPAHQSTNGRTDPCRTDRDPDVIRKEQRPQTPQAKIIRWELSGVGNMPRNCNNRDARCACDAISAARPKRTARRRRVRGRSGNGPATGL